MRQLLLLFALVAYGSSHAGGICSSDFKSFISRFEASPELQLSQTKFPLTYRYVDHDDPDMKMKRMIVQKNDQAKYLTFPSLAYQRKLKLNRKLNSIKSNKCSVVFNAPDSDMYDVEFKFEHQAGKWLLVEVENNSL